MSRPIRYRLPARSRAHRFSVGLALGALALGGLALSPTAIAPASAHDSLLGAVPADGETVEQAPQEVELTFSAEILDTGTAAVVTDAAGQEVTAGEPVLDGVHVRVPLPADLAPSDYTLVWRVVSSDGHPISGSTTFTVAGSAEEPATDEASDDPAAASSESAASSQPAATAESSANPEPAGSEEPTQTVASEAAEETAGTAESWVLPLVVGVGVMAVLTIGILVARRRRP